MARTRTSHPVRPIIVVWLAVALAVILAAYTVVALRQSRKTLEHAASRSAEALAESLALAIRNVTQAGTVIDGLWIARFKDAARTFCEGGRSPLPSRWLTEFDTRRIDLARLDGEILRSTEAGARGRLPDVLTRDESFQKLTEENWFSAFDLTGQPQAVLVREGDCVLVVWDGLDRLSVVQSDLGAGYLIRAISELPALEYVVLQGLEGIEMASRRVEEMSRIADDSLLLSALQTGRAVSRTWTFNDSPIIEAASPVAGDSRLLRVGVSRRSLESLDQSVTLQLSLLGGLLFVTGVGGLALWSTSQRVSDLQEDLDTAEALTEELFRSLAAGLLVVDPTGAVRLANPPAERLLQVPHASLVGRKYQEVAPGDPARLLPLLATGHGALEEEVEWTNPRGEKRTLLVSSTRLRSERAEAVAIIHDITDMRRLARQAEQTERLSAMGDLAAGVAHEVRNPLNAISIAAQRLAAEFVPTSEAEQYGVLLSHLRSEIDRVNTTVQEFLGLARGMHLAREPVDLNTILTPVARSLELEGSARQVKVEFSSPGKATVLGDRDALHKVFTNLTRNALQATKALGRVSLSLQPGQDTVTVVVEDTGTGIAPEDLPHVFRPYFTRRKGGSGLGLALVHRIVTDHGGTIDVASEPGRGSIFRVTLPTGMQGTQGEGGRAA